MGVVHKLTPEVKEFIVNKKQAEPHLSCRSITSFVYDKFQFKLSKSSANAIFKQIGLSMPVGRRSRKLAKPQPVKPAIPALPVTMPTLGEIILKAADYLLGASLSINQACPLLKEHILKLKLGSDPVLPDNLDADQPTFFQIKEILKNISQSITCLKVTLSDGKNIYFDGQMHTIWPTSQIPETFSVPINNLEYNITQIFTHGEALVLFFAPGYKEPSADFFDFLSSFTGSEKTITQAGLISHKQEEIKNIKIEQSNEQGIIFGVWPWQFKNNIKVSESAESKQLDIEGLTGKFYAAAADIELSQPKRGVSLKLRGVVLKYEPGEKVKLVILTNLPENKADTLTIASDYLKHWPNPEDSFQNYSRKIEAYARDKAAQEKNGAINFTIDQTTNTVSALLRNYLLLIELYSRYYFFPSKYLTENQETIKSRFYSLELDLKTTKTCQLATIKLPQNYSFQKDVEYVCRKINEKQVLLEEGKILRLETAFQLSPK